MRFEIAIRARIVRHPDDRAGCVLRAARRAAESIARRALIALSTQDVLVRKILAHLGLPTTAPILAPVRSPPELELDG